MAGKIKERFSMMNLILALQLASDGDNIVWGTIVRLFELLTVVWGN
jgi:hypothetical protein